AALGVAGAPALDLEELVEHPRASLGGDADAGVLDLDHAFVAVAARAQGDGPAGRRELDRVGEQVPDYLVEAAAVGDHGAAGLDLLDQVDALDHRRRPDPDQRVAERARQRLRLDADLELARAGPG